MYGIVAQLDPNNSGWVLYGDAIYDLAAMLLQLVVQNTLEVVIIVLVVYLLVKAQNKLTYIFILFPAG